MRKICLNINLDVFTFLSLEDDYLICMQNRFTGQPGEALGEHFGEQQLHEAGHEHQEGTVHRED